MVVDADRIKSIFLAAVERHAADQWPAYLDGACGDDAELRDRVERLLAAHGDQKSLHVPSPSESKATVDQSPAERPGGTIGPYKLMEELGEGGMGVVYVAEQARPVRRKVALKVIKPGMDSKQVVARFEAERQALAMMDHPNIAKVFDAGTTGSGRPYFVMELVRGIPITDYCDREGLSIRDRLDLFVLVCRAVQHAHQKGVIHRDLKPSNILVTVIDGAAVPKVIDFGVAKATGAALTDRTVYTGFHQMVGTPLYMSPEQADLSGVDVDTRSDIYALGVLLYELLTGTTPFDPETLRRAAFDEVRRIIREDQPPRPSTRLGTLGATLTTVSARRKTDPRHLGPAVRGELDWVVMKALEKDRRRRYETANDFAADVMRYLTDRPVEACPPSATYRLGKFARRNRAAMTTTALVSAALVVGTAVSAWQAFRAVEAGRRAVADRTRAEHRSGQARRAVDEMYSQVAEKWLARQPELSPLQREFLEKALAFYQEFAADGGASPEVRFEAARASERVGEIRAALERPGEAEPAFREALAGYERLAADVPGRPEYRSRLAATLGKLARQHHKIGRTAEAEQTYRRGIAIQEALIRDDPKGRDRHRFDLAALHRDIAHVWDNLNRKADAEAAVRKAREILRELAAEHPADAEYTARLADLEGSLGSSWSMLSHDRHAEAKISYQHAFDLRRMLLEKNPRDIGLRADQARDLINLGILQSYRSENVEALESLRSASAILTSLAAEQPDIPRHRMNLFVIGGRSALVLHHLGRNAEAEEVARKALISTDRFIAEFPENSAHQNMLGITLESLARMLFEIGKVGEAEESYRRGREVRERLVARYPDRGDYRHNLAIYHYRFSELFAASPRDEVRDPKRALDLARKSVENGPDNPGCWKILALAEYANGHWDAALKALDKDAELRGNPGYTYHDTIRAAAFARKGEMEKAREWFAKLPPKGDQEELADTPRRLYEEVVALMGERPPGGRAKPLPEPKPSPE